MVGRNYRHRNRHRSSECEPHFLLKSHKITRMINVTKLKPRESELGLNDIKLNQNGMSSVAQIGAVI